MKPEWETVEFDGKLYAFDMLPPELAIQLSLRVVEAFGGIIASFVPVLGIDSKDFDIFNIDTSALNLTSIQASMMSATSQLDPPKIKAIMDAVLPMCMVTSTADAEDKGHRCTYDDFNGNISTLYKVMFYALRYNFADFFGESPMNEEAHGAKNA
jgi:hypothetical protein